MKKSVTVNYHSSNNYKDVLIFPFFIQLDLLQLHGRMLNSTAHHPTYLFSLPARIALNLTSGKENATAVGAFVYYLSF